jgi:hypothetical protein
MLNTDSDTKPTNINNQYKVIETDNKFPDI